MDDEEDIPVFPICFNDVRGYLSLSHCNLLPSTEELHAMDLRLTEVFVPYLAFLVLLYKCKASPPLNNTVMSILLVLYPLFSSRCCSVFFYTVSILLLTVMTCI